MKKEYHKPQIVIENFVLNDYIAACTNRISFSQNCTIPEGLAGSYMEALIQAGGFNTYEKCSSIVDEIEGMVCYHNTKGTFQVFAS